MKKYAIILSLLIVVGVGLTITLLTQEEKLDQTVFLQTTESIRNLQTLDKNLLVLLNQSRFNAEFDHDTLLDTHYQLSEEFSNLRYDALFEEIESSPPLSEAVNNFDDRYASREEKLEAYVEKNALIATALSGITSTLNGIQSLELADAETPINRLISDINATIFSLTLGADLNKQAVLNQLNNLQVEAPTDGLNTFAKYKQSVIDVLDNHDDAASSFNTLSSLETGALLDNIEKEYVAYHNQAIKGSTLFRNALITYGAGLLGALIFFAWKIRQHFSTLEQEVSDRTQEIETAYNDLQESQEQLIQSEKMASLGQMVAGVAHEINTPLGYVSSNVETLKLNLQELSSVVNEVGTLMTCVTDANRDNAVISKQLMVTLKKYKQVDANELVDESEQLLNDGQYGLGEISTLVTSLKDFARLDRQTTEQVNLHDCIESSLTIASNHIRENNVTVERSFNELPAINCIPSKLNQLFLNLITNACQAMSDGGGTLMVATQQHDNQLSVSVKDQGIGMDQETQQKMFDPFFTSKEIGLGTGLGMSIAYKIVQAHNGHIAVNSELGKGTEIIVTLPLNKNNGDG